MFEALAVVAVNRLLRGNGWALERLRAHARKTALLVFPPFELKVTVREGGEIAAAPPEAVPDVTISATPGVALRLAARDESAWNVARVEGDVQFAAAIDGVLRNLEWDYEEDLSRIFGDVLGHRLGSTARELDRWGREALLNVGHALAEYATYEQPMIADARAIARFTAEVDVLRDDVERLEKRLEMLAQRLSSGGR